MSISLILLLFVNSFALADVGPLIVDPAIEAAIQAKFLTSKEYVTECESKGIEIPMTLDCKKGEEIKIYKSECDDVGKVLSKVEITEKNFQQYRSSLACDNPSHLKTLNPLTACIPGSRVQVINAKKGKSSCVLACRRTNFEAIFKKSFQDINMICNNPENGATCFFNSELRVEQGNTTTEPDFPGAKLPIPGTQDDNFWMKPSKIARSNCSNCHDNDPYIITPYLGKFGEELRAKTHSSPFDPYYIVGSKKPFNTHDWKKRLYLNESTNSCTQCHRIGKRFTCMELAATSVGDGKTRDTNSCTKKTNLAFMPPAHSKIPLDLIKADAARVLKCCNDLYENKKSDCDWAEIPGSKDVSEQTQHKAPTTSEEKTH